jgi:NAD(P)H-hydrate epimerase
MGPGLGTAPETQKWIRSVVANSELPLILDADALNAFAGKPSELKKRKSSFLAITPHPGEMARLLGVKSADVQSRRLEVAREAAASWNAFVILKGFHTILATPDGRVFVNTTGNPGLAKGGSGDVLTGILAGLTAEFGLRSWERTLGLGIYLHGLAADLAAPKVGETAMLATDVIESLPVAFAELQKASHRAAD